MPLLAWIVIGLLAGIAGLITTPRGGKPGCIVTFAVSIMGGLVGGFLSTVLGYGGMAGGLDWRNLAVAVLGAIVLLVLVRVVARRPS
jgi:uncharacterized membrane protein YeaQ/YmgE (transglycosylase-associated protein family)